MAQPDFDKKADFSVLSRQNSAYHFETQDFISSDGERRYRVFVGIPRKKTPKGGFSAVFALDGNAVLETLTEPRLQTLAASDRTPALVLLGYADERRLNVEARAYDYTIGPERADVLHPERRNGGAEAFLQLLETQILPAVGQCVATAPQYRTIWGHSYAGLLVLHIFSTRPQWFRRYVAADPAVWEAGGEILRELQGVTETVWRGTDCVPALWLMKSARRSEVRSGAAKAAQIRRRQMMARLPENALEQMAHKLSQAGVGVRYQLYPEDTHGSLFLKSFQAALSDGLA